MTDEELDEQPVRPVVPRRLGSSGTPPRMAKPIRGRPAEAAPEPVEAQRPEPVLDLTPDEPYDDLVEVPHPKASSQPEPEPAEEPAPLASLASDPQPEPPTKAGSEPKAESSPKLVPDRPDVDLPTTVNETLRRVDESWRAFHAAVVRFPAERMDERLTEHGWTRKQMLAHVAAWHDLTAERLLKFINTGEPPTFDQDTDRFNATVARRAVGKTAGEILGDTEATFQRLRRQVQRLTDPQLQANDAWAAWVIHGNTYGHYDEHWADVYVPQSSPGARR
jgi:hypothetical protein